MQVHIHLLVSILPVSVWLQCRYIHCLKSSITCHSMVPITCRYIHFLKTILPVTVWLQSEAGTYIVSKAIIYFLSQYGYSYMQVHILSQNNITCHSMVTITCRHIYCHKTILSVTVWLQLDAGTYIVSKQYYQYGYNYMQVHTLS